MVRIITHSAWLFLLVSVSAVSAYASPYRDIPGSIPLQYEKQAASDLVYEGQVLFPDEARQLYEDGVVKDLSLLNPAEDSILWKNEFPIQLPESDDYTLDKNGETVEVLEVIPPDELIGDRFGLRVLKIFQNGEKKIFRLIFDIKAHNILLRKALLEKIGYKLPQIQPVEKISLKFKGAFSKNEMLRALNRKTFLDVSRWVVGTNDEASAELTVQDVIAIEGAEYEFYDLSEGIIPSERIRGRRILNSLLVPYSLLDVPESVNLLNWYPARVSNDLLMFDYFQDYREQFDPSYEDARWITRRILKLTKQDWEQIVEKGHYPDEVAYLLLQKLISRRNYLVKALHFTKEFKEIPFQESPNFGKRLKKGKLTGGRSWDGYASQFAGTDPDDPISSSELWAFFKSKGLTNIIASAVNEFNVRYVPQTDIGFKIFDHQLDVAAKEFARYIQTGETRKVPFGIWSTTYYDMNIITNREIVAGNYLGSENIVQVADTMGFSVDAGYYIGADGLPTKVSLDARAKVNFYRTYTHLKPIKSIKAGLKEPFKNMMVPFLKFQDAEQLAKLEALGKRRGSMEEEKAVQEAAGILEEFKKQLSVGESIIIQTAIGPEASINAGYGFNENLAAYARLKDKITVLSRLHIYRLNENEIQVYRDPALFNVFDVSVGLRAKIQILELGWAWTLGTSKTEFFSLNFKLNTSAEKPFEENPDLFDNAGALKRVLRWSRLDQLRIVQKPWVVEHDFSEKTLHFDFLWWRYLNGTVKDEIKVIRPEGESKKFYRYTVGKRSGADFQTLALDILDTAIDEFTEIGQYIQLSSTNSGNPADTFQGNSVSRQISVEGTDSEDGGLDLSDIYLAADYRWKGWTADRRKIEKIFKEIKEKLGQSIFRKEVLIGADTIRFYSVDLSIALFEEGVQHMIGFNPNKVRELYLKHSNIPSNQGRQLEVVIGRVQSKLSDAQKYKKKKKSKELAKVLSELFHTLEGTLKFEGMVKVVGGIDNMYVQARLSGFRTNIENGDRTILSDTLGRVGSEKPRGPLRYLQSQTGISEGELLVYWLLNKF